MEAELDNPAGRLHRFLVYCWGNNTSTPVNRTWASYLNDGDNDSASYVAAMAQLSAIPGEIRSALEALPETPALPKHFFLELIPRFEEIITSGALNQQTSSAHFREQFDRGDLAQLEMLSRILSGNSGSPIPDDVLQEISSLAQQILDLLADDEVIEGGLRELLHELGRGLRDVIDNFRIYGQQGIARERDLLLGRLISNPDLASKLLSNKRAAPIVRRTLIVAGIALSLFNSGTEAVDNAPKALEHVQHLAELVAPLADHLEANLDIRQDS